MRAGVFAATGVDHKECAQVLALVLFAVPMVTFLAWAGWHAYADWRDGQRVRNELLKSLDEEMKRKRKRGAAAHYGDGGRIGGGGKYGE